MSESRLVVTPQPYIDSIKRDIVMATLEATTIEEIYEKLNVQ